MAAFRQGFSVSSAQGKFPAAFVLQKLSSYLMCYFSETVNQVCSFLHSLVPEACTIKQDQHSTDMFSLSGLNNPNNRHHAKWSGNSG